jgi:Family of unknown function (DUF5677)
MTDTIEENFTEAEMREMLTELLEGWRNDRGSGQDFETKAHAAVVGTVYALTAHAHKLGYAVANLIDAGFALETIPVIRAAYESAITASWIAQVPDALPAYLNRDHNQQKALRDTVKKAGWAAGKQVIAADTLEPYLVSAESKTGASKTEVLCKDFIKGDGLYSLYRGLSWMTHPTAAVTDLYLEMRRGSEIPTLHTTARYDRDFMTTWLHVMCSSLVWSARALNLVDSRRAKSGDRQRLRIAAKRLHTDEFLAVKPDATFRGKKSERKRARTMTE